MPSAVNSAVVTAHVCATAKAVREKEEGISSSRYRRGPKIVNTDGNARAVGQGDGEDGQRTVWREVLRA